MRDLTEKDINAMIAKFVGDEKIHPRKRDYQKSWDWLIPVANKIIRLYVEQFGVLQKELRNDESFIARMAVKSMFSLSINNQLEINSVYLRCADFIQWYNKIYNGGNSAKV